MQGSLDGSAYSWQRNMVPRVFDAGILCSSTTLERFGMVWELVLAATCFMVWVSGMDSAVTAGTGNQKPLSIAASIVQMLSEQDSVMAGEDATA